MESVDLESHGDDVSTLTGLVVFPDPTLGGLFPDLTNANFWPTMKALQDVRNRVPAECSSSMPYAGSSPSGCKLPVNPSDLDILVYFLGMGFF